MKKAIKRRKVFHRIWITICVLLILLFGAVYYTLKFKIKDVIEQIVLVQTDHQYSLTLTRVDLSLLKKRIKLKNAELTCIHPDKSVTYYHAQIPQVSFSIRSWISLFFSNSTAIDNLQIMSPNITIYEAEKKVTNKEISFETSTVFDILQKMIAHLKIYSMNTVNATVTFSSSSPGELPFVIDKIDLSVKNFRKKYNDESHFLSSENIKLHIGKQDWKLPGTNNEMSFSQLNFSAKDQYFEMDSFHFSETEGKRNNATDLSADKFLFSSKQLSAFYEKEELLLDTLILYHPVLYFTIGEKPSGKDSLHIVRNFIKNLFTNINLNYIAVKEGQILISNAHKNSIYSTQKTDLKILNLNIKPASDNYFTVGSVDLQLNQVRLYSKDSLFLLNIGEFGFNNNDLVCKNVLFIPTEKNISSKGLNIFLPNIVLNDISFEELFQKKFQAVSAEFDRPNITINSRDRKNKKVPQTNGLSGFYNLLHGLGQLIAVEKVNVVDGNVSLKLPSATASITNVNASIQLNDFLNSTSLFNLMQALSKLQAGEVKISSPGFNILLNQLSSEGRIRKNRIGSFAFILPGGGEVKGSNLFFENADWDLFYKTNKLTADEFNIQKLSITGTQTQQAVSKKILTGVSIDKFHVGELNFNYALLNKSHIKFSGQNISLDGLSNNDRLFTWQHATGLLNNIIIENKTAKTTIAKANFSSNSETFLNQIKYVKNGNSIAVPSVQLKANINSSDFSKFNFDYVYVNNPVIKIQAGIEEKKSNDSSSPLNVDVRKIKINNAILNYFSQKDSAKIIASVNMIIDSLSASKANENLLKYKEAQINISPAQFENKKLHALIPEVVIHSSKGRLNQNADKKISLNTDLTTEWSAVKLYPKNQEKSTITLDNFSGKLTLTSFAWTTGEKIPLQDVINNSTITDGKLYYKDSTVTIKAGKLQWEPTKANLTIEYFSGMPNITRDDFLKNAAWQSDYITTSCDTIMINGIDIQKWMSDSIVKVNDIIFKNPSITSTRDKNIPFKHGLEKWMPTKFISTIKQPFHIDSIFVKQSTITVNEISNITNREATIPLTSVNATLANVTNMPAPNDSLYLKAMGRLLDFYIRDMRYTESYSDSLSGFRMTAKMSPIDLTTLSKITNPSAGVDITRGHADTLYESVAGNKYGAFGEMKFYYHGLRILILDTKDTTKKDLILTLKNIVADKIIVRNNNKKRSTIFFIRDTEKFIFNYWIKITFSGVLTSTRVKSSRKYHRQYLSFKKQHTLPDYTNGLHQ